MIILDTNVVSAVMTAQIDVVEWLDRQPRTSIWTTTVTVLEIRFGLEIMPTGLRRRERTVAFDRAISEKLQTRILSFDDRAAEETALLMANRHRLGKPRELRDSMIAGIVIANRATLATRNARHFDDIDMPIVDPWTI